MWCEKEVGGAWKNPPLPANFWEEEPGESLVSRQALSLSLTTRGRQHACWQADMWRRRQAGRQVAG